MKSQMSKDFKMKSKLRACYADGGPVASPLDARFSDRIDRAEQQQVMQPGTKPAPAAVMPTTQDQKLSFMERLEKAVPDSFSNRVPWDLDSYTYGQAVQLHDQFNKNEAMRPQGMDPDAWRSVTVPSSISPYRAQAAGVLGTMGVLNKATNPFASVFGFADGGAVTPRLMSSVVSAQDGTNRNYVPNSAEGRFLEMRGTQISQELARVIGSILAGGQPAPAYPNPESIPNSKRIPGMQDVPHPAWDPHNEVSKGDEDWADQMEGLAKKGAKKAAKTAGLRLLGRALGPVAAAGMTGYDIGSRAYDAMPADMQDTIGGTIDMAKMRLQGYSSGGKVTGPGGPTEDKIPAMLSAGEYVLPADTVRAVGKENLDALKDATHRDVARRPSKLRVPMAGGGSVADEWARRVAEEGTKARMQAGASPFLQPEYMGNPLDPLPKGSVFLDPAQNSAAQQAAARAAQGPRPPPKPTVPKAGFKLGAPARWGLKGAGVLARFVGPVGLALDAGDVYREGLDAQKATSLAADVVGSMPGVVGTVGGSLRLANTDVGRDIVGRGIQSVVNVAPQWMKDTTNSLRNRLGMTPLYDPNEGKITSAAPKPNPDSIFADGNEGAQYTVPGADAYMPGLLQDDPTQRSGAEQTRTLASTPPNGRIYEQPRTRLDNGQILRSFVGKGTPDPNAPSLDQVVNQLKAEHADFVQRRAERLADQPRLGMPDENLRNFDKLEKQLQSELQSSPHQRRRILAQLGELAQARINYGLGQGRLDEDAAGRVQRDNLARMELGQRGEDRKAAREQALLQYLGQRQLALSDRAIKEEELGYKRYEDALPRSFIGADGKPDTAAISGFDRFTKLDPEMSKYVKAYGSIEALMGKNPDLFTKMVTAYRLQSENRKYRLRGDAIQFGERPDQEAFDAPTRIANLGWLHPINTARAVAASGVSLTDAINPFSPIQSASRPYVETTSGQMFPQPEQAELIQAINDAIENRKKK